MEDIDHYTLLGISKDATHKEILTAYQQAARDYHSDRHGDEDARQCADELLARINEAKDVLVDADKRRLYDLYGPEGLTQLAKVDLTTTNMDRFQTALQHYLFQKRLQDISEIASPKSEYTARINLQKRVSGITGANYRPDTYQGVAAVTMQQEFTHRLAEKHAIVVNGSLEVGHAGKPMVFVEPSNPQNRHPFANLGTANSFGVRYDYAPFNPLLVTRSIGIEATGEGTFLTGMLREPLLGGVEIVVEGTGSFDTSATTANVKLVKDLTPDNTESKRIFQVQMYPQPVEFSFLAYTAKTSIHARVDLNSQWTLAWNRSSNVTVQLASTQDDFFLGYQLHRSLDNHTSIHFGSRVNLSGAMEWYLEYERHHQKVSAPIRLTDELPSIGWLAAFFLAPVVADLFVRHVIMRPYKNAQRASRKVMHDAEVKTAKTQQSFMKNHAEKKRLSELAVSGIVVLEARYGYDVDNDDAEDSTWIDVSIPLQYRVSQESDVNGVVCSRLVIPDSVTKSMMPGWALAAPEEDAVLYVQYMYNGVYHYAEFDDDEVVVIPSSSHKAEEERYQGVAWWDKGFQEEEQEEDVPAAEGAAGFVDID